jgi:hypothetical protein
MNGIQKSCFQDFNYKSSGTWEEPFGDKTRYCGLRLLS